MPQRMLSISVIGRSNVYAVLQFKVRGGIMGYDSAKQSL